MKFFTQVVDCRDEETLMPFILAFIAPGSIISSDMWRLYNDIVNQVGHTLYSSNGKPLEELCGSCDGLLHKKD